MINIVAIIKKRLSVKSAAPKDQKVSDIKKDLPREIMQCIEQRFGDLLKKQSLSGYDWCFDDFKAAIFNRKLKDDPDASDDPKAMNDRAFSSEVLDYWHHTSEFEKLPDHWREDEDIIKGYLSVNPYVWSKLSQQAKGNERIKKFAIKMSQQLYYGNNPERLQGAPPGVWEDSAFVKRAIWKHPDCFDWAPRQIKGDKAFQKYALESKSKKLINADDDIQRLALTEEKKAARMATITALSQQEDVVLLAITDRDSHANGKIRSAEKSAKLLHHVPVALRNNPVFMRDAIACNEYAYDYLGDSLKTDEALAKQILAKSTRFYKTMPETLKENPDLALFAAKHIVVSPAMFPKCILDNKKFALALVSKGAQLDALSPELRADRDVVFASITSKSPNASKSFRYADAKFFSDRELVEIAIKGCGSMLQLADPQLKKDKELVLLAVQNDPLALRYADAELQKDIDVLKIAIKGNSRVLEYVSKEIQKDSKLKKLFEILENPEVVDLSDPKEFGLGLFFFGDHFLTIKTPTHDDILALIREDPAQYIGFFDTSMEVDFELRDKVIEAFSEAYDDMRVSRVKEVVKRWDFQPNLKTASALKDGFSEEVVDELYLEFIEEKAAWLPFLPEAYAENLKLILGLLEKQSFAFRFASQALRSNPEAVSKAVAVQPAAIKDATNEILEDHNFLKSLATDSPKILNLLPETTLKSLMELEPSLLLRLYPDPSREDYLNMLGLSSKAWQFVPDSLQQDQAFLIQALVRQPALLKQDLDDTFRRDRSFLLDVLKKQANIWPFIEDAIKTDKTFILEAIGRNIAVLEKEPHLKKDAGMMFEAGKDNVRVFKQVDSTLWEDRDFVKRVAKANWRALAYANQELLSDKDFVEELIGIEPKTVWMASETLKNNAEGKNHFTAYQRLVKKALEKDPSVIKKIDNEVLRTKLFLLRMVGQIPKIFNFLEAGHPLIDQKFMESLINTNHASLAFAPEKWRANKKLAKLAIGKDKAAFAYVAESLKKDPEFIAEQLKVDGLLLEELPHFQDNYRLVALAINQNPKAYRYASANLKQNQTLAELAVKNNPELLGDVPYGFKEYYLVVIAAAKKDLSSLEKVPEIKRNNMRFMVSILKEVPEGVQYLGKKLRDNKFQMSTLLRNAPDIKEWLPESESTAKERSDCGGSERPSKPHKMKSKKKK